MRFLEEIKIQKYKNPTLVHFCSPNMSHLKIGKNANQYYEFIISFLILNDKSLKQCIEKWILAISSDISSSIWFEFELKQKNRSRLQVNDLNIFNLIHLLIHFASKITLNNINSTKFLITCLIFYLDRRPPTVQTIIQSRSFSHLFPIINDILLKLFRLNPIIHEIFLLKLFLFWHVSILAGHHQN